MQTRQMSYAGQSVALPDLPRYARFYEKLSAGKWEPRTFAVLQRNLNAQTTYIDIGAWIGVTPFWAAGLARHVIAVEPDPACLEILRALAPGYPNLTLLEGALSPDQQVTLHAVDGFGSSESSVLAIGAGANQAARGWTAADILSHAKPGQVFVKIDIEGYEYLVKSEIARFLSPDLVGMQIALHPALYAETLKGPHLWRRLRAALMTRSLARVFAHHFGTPRIHKHRNLLSYLCFGIMLSSPPQGTDFVFERARG